MIDPFSTPVSTSNITTETFGKLDEDPDKRATAPSDWEFAMHSDRPFSSSEGSGFWVYDLEAIPDPARFPKPVEKVIEHDDSPTFIEDALRTEATIKLRLGKGVKPDQATLLIEEEKKRTKGPRKGVLSALEKYLESGDAELREWKNLAKKPATASIVAMSICMFGDPVPRVWLAKNQEEEIDLLNAFFEIHNRGATRVGFNIAEYDDKLIFWRALQLGVTTARRLHLSRYGGKGSVDLMRKMFSGLDDAMKLKTLLKMIGIVPPAGDTDGGMVNAMVEAGEWEKLAMYVASDAWSEMQLLIRLQQILEMA